MEMRKCPNGHYYDASIHAACPYCTGANNSGATLPLDSFSGGNGGSPTMPLTGATGGGSDKTMALQAAMNESDSDDGRTVALIKEEKGIDPVVGWLVCTEGKEKGRDYRIHADNNFIGRSDRMDICIRGDETISRENHAILSYDTVENTFFFSPGDGRAIVRVNGKATFQTVELAPYDEIVIGKTVVKFVPFCSKEFVW
ncbi:FHA domain-containing protein [Butyrivibrio sp. WCD2001]|uniref:FHA domain-containing protein n=1 Tax=Butyrivibrio sp. WCD2001 TaxID=1280681 RepID=UPI00041126E7|nr:FHA domain-containing protein [Butyrivibrio sp. WCD2001]